MRHSRAVLSSLYRGSPIQHCAVVALLLLGSCHASHHCRGGVQHTYTVAATTPFGAYTAVAFHQSARRYLLPRTAPGRYVRLLQRAVRTQEPLSISLPAALSDTICCVVRARKRK